MPQASDFTSPNVESQKEGKALLEQAKAKALVEKWLREIRLAQKREKKFRKSGNTAVKLYECDNPEEVQFNILFSNTETLSPALYNNTPRPVVERRFKDEDELGKIAAQATARVLEFLIDPGEQEYSPFDQLMTASVLEALVPGRGVTWFKYEPSWGDEGETQLTGETVCGEEVPWDRFLHGYGKKWPQVPWVAREHLFTKEEAVKAFGEDIADELTYDEFSESDDDGEGGSGERKEESAAGAKLARVWEIWDKATKKVLFISSGFEDGPLKLVDDPLNLKGFFPCPTPLTFLAKISSLVPVPLYNTYKAQAQELNEVTKRINALVKACKVRGFYDATLQGLDKVLTSGDNHLEPIDNVANLISQGLSLEKSIWLVPIEKIVAVLQQLYLAREQIKATIYEITGIADIMRGSSQASETLGAQELKNQWGTLRLKRLQKRVAHYVRESLRIMAEIAVSKFSEEKLSQMTGLPWPTSSQKEAAMAVQQAAQMAGQQPDEGTLSVTTAPSWGEILSLLKSDLTRSYRIDIETNSTVDAEATEDKQNITDLVNAMAQFMNGIAPLIESGTMPFDVAKQMLLTIVRRFRFGPEMEEALKTMAAPQPKPDPKAEALKQKAAIDAKSAEQKMAQEQQKFEGEKAKFQAEMSRDQQKAELEKEMMLLEAQLKREELNLKREEMVMKRQDMQAQTRMKQHQMQLDMQFAQESHGQKVHALRETTAATIESAKMKANAKPVAGKPQGGK